MKLKSLQLAELIVNSVNIEALPEELVKTLGNDELLSILKQRDIEQLAYWLNLHSFTKHRLAKSLEQFEKIDPKNPEKEQQTAINNILSDYFREKVEKRKLQKFIDNDFSQLSYINRKKVVNDLLNITLRGDRSVTADDIQYLINAKSRRAESLGRKLNLHYISAKDYASESTTRKLAKSMLNLKPGDRSQILYYYLGEQHAYGFDVEVDNDGKIKIFCFESAGDPHHLEGIDRLYKYLKKSGRDFEIKSCRAEMQKDDFNCAVYTIATLNEFSKYDHVYEYLPKDFTADTSLNNMNQMVVNKPTGGTTTYTFDNLDKIIWVKLQDMPTKVISMGQSYTEMLETLKQSQNFDLDPNLFIANVKKRDQFDEQKPVKYIQRRREHIAANLERVQQQILESAYKEFLKENPIFEKIAKGDMIDYRKEVTENPKYSTLREKLDVLASYMRVILLKNDVGFGYVNKASVEAMPLTDLRAFLEIRNEYLRAMSNLSLADFRNEYYPNAHPLKTNVDEYVDFSKFNPAVASANQILWQSVPDYMEKILLQDSDWQYPRYFRIPNPLEFDPNNMEMSEEDIKSLIEKTNQSYKTKAGEPILTTKMILELIDAYYKKINEMIEDDTVEKLRMFAKLQNIYLHYAKKLGAIEDIVYNVEYNSLFSADRPIREAAKTDPPLKTVDEMAAEIFTVGELAYIDQNLRRAKKYFPTIQIKNPILSLAQDKDNLKNFTAQKIINIMDNMEKTFSYKKGVSLLPIKDGLKYLQNTFKEILGLQKKEDRFTRQEINHIFYEMSCAYYLLSEQIEDNDFAITIAHGRLTYNLDLILGDTQKPLTVDKIRMSLDYLKDPFVKLRIIQYAFQSIIYNSPPMYTNHNKLSLSSYSDRQLHDIEVLQKAYLQIFSEVAQSNPNEETRKKLQSSLNFERRFIDFHATPFTKLFETKMRKAVKQLLPPEPRVKEEKKKTDEQIPKSTTVIPETAKSDTARFFSKEKKEQVPQSVSEVALQYYHMDPVFTFGTVDSQFVINKIFNLRMYKFASSQDTPYNTLWVTYGSAKTDTSDQEYDWKLNFSIDPKDIEKALPIMIETLLKYNIGAMKVMSEAQVAFTRRDRHMVGREFVMYWHHNPEIKPEKWLQIIQEIEKKLDEANIQPSVKNCPVSNRQIGKFTSYTHEAWTAKVLNIHFKEGIKESGLADEDPFQNFTYEPKVELPEDKRPG